MALKFPVIFLLPAHLQGEQIEELESQIPTLTYDPKEAEVFLGRITQKMRAEMELRKRNIHTEEVQADAQGSPTSSPRSKRRKLAEPPGAHAAASDSDSTYEGAEDQTLPSDRSPSRNSQATVKVVKIPWLTGSIKAGALLPMQDYLVYEGRKLPQSPPVAPITTPPRPKGEDIMKRAAGDVRSEGPGSSTSSPRFRKKAYGDRGSTTLPAIPTETTTDHDGDTDLPPIPAYLRTKYACQRPTPVNPPNIAFIEALKEVRTIRTLKGDEIGVRAYSTSIATLSAYPYTISSAREVERLPGCGPKTALLYYEFTETGKLSEVKAAESDTEIATLRLFYEIFGVGAATAREFYLKGWRDLDDVVDYGWQTLSRVQQIGVKYYDDFQLKIPRGEVERIAGAILEHARTLQPGYEMTIVGGYRRGKLASGDVDVILSHRDETATRYFVDRIVQSLEQAKLIKHLLSHSHKNSEREQMPVSWKGNVRGSGFDTLDKALVVWQDPDWSTGEETNPNPHRRVDIIISPWRTVGCAVLGWTSGTTFQRDLRRYCKAQRSLKFDSSGVRSRKDGSWVDMETGRDGQPPPDMLSAERRVFEALELEYRPPEERCTG